MTISELGKSQLHPFLSQRPQDTPRLTSEQEETTLLFTVCVLAPCDRNMPAVTGAA